MKMELSKQILMRGIGEHFRRYAHALRFAIGLHQGRQTGGGVGGGVLTPPEFGWGGLNTCQPPLILRKIFLGGVGSP